MKTCEKHPKAPISTLRGGEEVCTRCIEEEYVKYDDTFVSSDGQRDIFEERLLDVVFSQMSKKPLYPCPKCGVPYSMFDPSEYHIDPPLCKVCWAKEKPSLVKRISSALVLYKERRTKFSNASPGIGKRKNDV